LAEYCPVDANLQIWVSSTSGCSTTSNNKSHRARYL
jgi:hypothetical protein